MEVAAIILPVVLMIGIGKTLKVLRLIDDRVVDGFKAVIANLMLPVTLFNALLTTKFDKESLILTAAVFAALCLILGAGYILRPLFGKYKTFAPFLAVSFEGGMLGYALYMTIYGPDSLGTVLKFDLANVLFAFTVFLFFIKMTGSGKVEMKKILIDYVRTPAVYGILLGLLGSLTGFGAWFAGTAAYQVYTSTVSTITAPLGALVLLSVGYALQFDREILWSVVKVSLARLLLNGAALAAILFLFRPFFEDRALLVGILLIFAMPGQYITTIYIKDREEQKFASTQLSFYTLFSVAAYILILAFVPR